MADTLVRSRSSTTAQASAAVTADTLSTGTKTQISLAASGNADGAIALEFEIDVTTAPTTAGYAEVWCEPLQHDGTGDSAPFRCARVPIAIETTADKYTCDFAGTIPEKANYIIKAIDFGFTATLTVVAKFLSDT